MEASNNISEPKTQVRPFPSADQFPIYMKSTNYVNPMKPAQRAIYKLTTPNSFMALSIINESVDMRIRCYDKVKCQAFDDYLRGTPEWELSNADEFEKLLLDVQELQLAYARQGVII